MLFNSLTFAVFFPLVTAVYFALPHRHRWWWLLLASSGFYMWFVPAYILILGFTITVDYFAGLALERLTGAGRRRLLLGCSLAANLGVLGFFKYFNFANENLAALAHAVGWNYSIRGLEIALPIGLSFHTFQAMSYTIEVYRGAQRAERHPGIFALYVLFYPQLVAGPIERPQNLLHQFREPHHFDYDRVTSGLRLMAWGLFKKMVIADRLALVTGGVFAAPANFSGPVIVLAVVAFSFQIYCDFSGYSDVALGSARVMGFRLMQNFDRPYAARTIAQFWRRWHISLSSWFRDYLYAPLGGHAAGVPRWYANLLVVFLVSGLWHGAAWTYVIWGALHGGYLVFGRMTREMRERWMTASGLARRPRLRGAVQVMTTFILVTVAWVFFRAPSFASAIAMFKGAVHGWHGVGDVAWWKLQLSPLDVGVKSLGAVVVAVVAMEWIQWRNSRGSIQSWLVAQPWWWRWCLYYAMAAILFFFQAVESDRFIYFQF